MTTHGGKREGAGRKKGTTTTETLTVRIPADLMDELKAMSWKLDEDGEMITLSKVVTALLRDALR